MNTNDSRRGAWLGLGTMAALLAAALAIGPLVRTSAASEDGAATATPWLADIESGADHIEPEALADELLAARGDVALVDLRPADEFAAWHLPGALSMTRRPLRSVAC